jgi:hypothetical protein
MPSAGGLVPSDLERPWKVHFQASTPADWGCPQVFLDYSEEEKLKP